MQGQVLRLEDDMTDAQYKDIIAKTIVNTLYELLLEIEDKDDTEAIKSLIRAKIKGVSPDPNQN